MSQLGDSSVDLVVTSPPYPMIEMWDEIMSNQNPYIKEALEDHRPELAFELMHKELDVVWKECYRVVKDGGFICINIGDATRTIDGEFRLYNNHSRITQYCTSLGLTNLPNIIWRKQTNAPNKFMGSGMLPCGAYITLEHEYILIFRIWVCRLSVLLVLVVTIHRFLQQVLLHWLMMLIGIQRRSVSVITRQNAL